MAEGVDDDRKTLLHNAVLAGLSYDVATCLDNDLFSVNAQDSDGQTPLHLACLKGFHDIAIQLLLKGANVNIQDNKGKSALHTAHKNVCNVMFIMLLNSPANLNIQDEDGQTVLHLVCSELCELLQRLCLLDNERKRRRRSIVMEESNQIDICEYEKIIQIMNVILQKGIDTNIKNSAGKTPLAIVLGSVIYHAFSRGSDDSYLYYFIEGSLFDRLFKRNRLRNATDEDINSDRLLTHMLCLLMYEYVIYILLEGGADISLCSGSVETPQHSVFSLWVNCSYLLGNVQNIIVDRLLNDGVSINVRNANGYTPIQFVTSLTNNTFSYINNSHYQSAKTLIMWGADINARTNNGKCPIHLTRNKEIIKLFAVYGADINACDNKGRTPLHLAVENWRSYDIVEELLKRQAHVNVQDNKGQTPLHIAVSSEIAVSEHGIKLLDNGALACIRDANGNTPVDLALKIQNFVQFIKHLIWLIIGRMHPYMEITVGNDDVNEYRLLCLKECEKLKSVRFGCISLYNILKPTREPAYVANKLLEATIKNPQLKTDFPIYGRSLRRKFWKDQERYEMLNSAKLVFLFISNNSDLTSIGKWCTLPEEIQLNILSYLTDEELQNLIQCLNTDVC